MPNGKKKSYTKKKNGTSSKKNSSRRLQTSKAAQDKLTAQKALIGMINPYATKDGTQIPDGALTHSMPIKHRDVFELDSRQAGGLRQPIMILLYAGLDGGCIWADNAFGNDMKYRWYTNDSNFTGTRPETELAEGVGDRYRALYWELKNSGSYAKWRHISTSLRLNLINNFDDNDGWWDCARFNVPLNTANWEIKGESQNLLTDLAAGKNYRVQPRYDLVAQMFSDLNADQKSYNVGPLRDIHKYQFTLAHLEQDHEVIDLKEYYSFDGTNDVDDPEDISSKKPADFRDLRFNADTGVDWPETPKPFAKAAPNGTKFIEDMISQSFDMIMIRIFPTSKQNSNSLLIGDLMSHREVVYTQDNDLHKFMRPAPMIDVEKLKLNKRKIDAITENCAIPTNVIDPDEPMHDA